MRIVKAGVPGGPFSSALSSAKYLNQERKEERDPSQEASSIARYLDAGSGELTFERMLGKGAEAKGLTNGITYGVHEELWHGEFDRAEDNPLCRTGYHRVMEDDPDNPGQKRQAIDPETGKGLTEYHRTPAFGIVVAAGKDVSVALLAAHKISPEFAQALMDDWDAAVAVGVSAMEELAVVARVPVPKLVPAGGWEPGDKRTTTQRVTADWAVAAVTQLGNRPTEESLARPSQISDIHLHTHLIAYSQVWVDGRAYTADEHDLLKDGRVPEAITAAITNEHVRLWEARGVQFDFITNRKGQIEAHVVGVSEEATHRYSSNMRRAEELAREYEAKHGKPLAKGDVDRLMAATRKTKSADDKLQDNVETADFDLWNEDLDQAGLTAGTLELKEIERPDELTRLETLRQRMYEPDGLTRDEAVFYGNVIMPTIVRKSIGLGFTLDELRGFEASFRTELVPLRTIDDNDAESLYTTNPILAKESEIKTWVAYTAAQKDPRDSVPSKDIVKLAMKNWETETGFKLDPSQKAAISRLTSRNRFVMGEAEAGAAKTTTMKIAIGAWRLHDPKMKFVLVSTSAHTARNSGRVIGVDWAGAVEGLELSPREIDDKTIVIIDEVAMMDTDRMARLVKRISPSPRMFTLGDPKQLQPIGAGGWYGDVSAAHGKKMFRLTEVHRHKGEHAKAHLSIYRQVRNGQADAAIRRMDNMGLLHVADDAAERVRDVTKMYTGLRDVDEYGADDIRIISDGSNDEIDKLNRFVQRDRQARAEVKLSGIRVRDQEQGRNWLLCEGDSILTLKGIGEDRNRIRNGQTGTIIRVDKDRNSVRVKFDNGAMSTISLNLNDWQQPIGLSYAVHAAKYQGSEVKVALVMPGSGQSNRFSAYSMLTRAINKAIVFIDHETHGGEERSIDPKFMLGQLWKNGKEALSATAVKKEQDDLAPSRWDKIKDAVATKWTERHDKPAEPRQFEPEVLQPGDVVLAGDRENYGHVRYTTDQTVTVHFVSPTGREATVAFPADDVTFVRRPHDHVKETPADLSFISEPGFLKEDNFIGDQDYDMDTDYEQIRDDRDWWDEPGDVGLQGPGLRL